MAVSHEDTNLNTRMTMCKEPRQSRDIDGTVLAKQLQFEAYGWY